MSNAAFNVAFGAFLSAGLDYATCAAKSRELHLSQLTKAGLITAHGRRGYRVYRAVAS